MPKGIYFRTPVMCAGISRSKIAFFKNHPEAKRKISVMRKTWYQQHPEECSRQADVMRIWQSKHPDFFKGENNPMFGKNDSVRGSANPFFGHRHTLETRLRISEAGFGRRHSEESRRKISATKRAQLADGSVVPLRGRHHPWFGRHHTVETKALISKANRGRRVPDDVLRKLLGKSGSAPNDFEEDVLEYLNLNFPGMWKYCGDGSLIINGRSPDFVDTNGRKKVILANGRYWHNVRHPNLTRLEIEKAEAGPFIEFGFEVLFIWSDDFYHFWDGKDGA